MRSDRITKLLFDGVTLQKVGELANEDQEPLLPVPISDISVGPSGWVYLTSRLNNQIIRVKPIPSVSGTVTVSAEGEFDRRRWVASHLDSPWQHAESTGPFMPRFAPDGSSVAFIQAETGSGKLLNRANPRKSGSDKILYEGPILDYCWDSVATRLALSLPEGEACSILILDTRDGSAESIIQQGFNISPVFDSKGERLAYLKDVSGSLDLFVLDLERNTESQITGGVGNNCFPLFFGEKDELLFTSDYFSSADVIYSNRHGKDQIRLTREPGDDWGGRFNPADGKVYFLSERDNRAAMQTDDENAGLASLYSIRKDGSYLALISPEGFGVDCFSIARDSGRVVFSLWDGSTSRIMEFSPQSGSRLLTGELDHRFPGLDVSPDGSDVILVGLRDGARTLFHLGDGQKPSPVS
jgi:Tol biopolymer transport system component